VHALTTSAKEKAALIACTGPRTVTRLLCMMIDALRYAGIAYSYGMMRYFSLPLYLKMVPFLLCEYSPFLFPLLCSGRVSETEGMRIHLIQQT